MRIFLLTYCKLKIQERAVLALIESVAIYPLNSFICYSPLMEKRFQVFVSSTLTDLAEERRVVMEALVSLGCIPAGMELFPAADEDQWSLIKSIIDECDYYVVVLGGRYGSIGPDGMSYTRMEYEYALSRKLPVVAFVHESPATLPRAITDSSPLTLKKLEDFRTLVRQKTVRF